MIVEAEAAAPSSSSLTPIKSSPPEKIKHKRKRRSRSHAVGNDLLSIDNDCSSSLRPHLIEKTSHTTKLFEESEAAAASLSSPNIIQLPSQEKIEHKRKRKSRRRRRGNDAILIKDDVSLLRSHREEGTDHTTSLESNDKLVQTTEEIENNLHIHDDSSNNTTTAAALKDETLVICGDKDEYETGQIVPNATDTDNRQTAASESMNSTEAANMKEDTAKNKMKKTQIKKPTTASKSTTTSSTGKEGECLRRIKHEWKDAVRSGIAYDWINMKTIRNTNTSSSAYVRIGPFGKNLLRWHFSVVGPANSVYENGIYHGRVLLPKDYPASPPRVQMITPSGRFIPGEDICLSASSYHPETWSPRWTVLSLVNGLRLHMLTTANEIGGVLASDEKRRQYAIESRSWKYYGIANHERMVAENIFELHSWDGQETTMSSEESNIVNNSVASASCSDTVATTEDNTNEMKNGITSDGKTITDSTSPSIEHELDTSKCPPVKKKAEKQKKLNDLKGENNDFVPTEENAVVLSSDLAIIHENEASKPTSTKKKTKKRKKSTATPTVEIVENSTRGTTKRAKDASKRTSVEKKKKNRKKVTNSQVQVKEEENQNILNIALKRVLVEMLKLPLRLLATMLRILDRLEKYMRAILDSII